MTSSKALQSEIGMAPGEDMGASDWLVVTQEFINKFADATLDQDPMHVDPEWCRAHGPFKTTISFGFLSLSLITHFSHQARPWPAGSYALNYGLEKVRFVAPVPVGSRIRGVFRFLGADRRADGGWLTRTEVTVEIEGSEKPAVAAEWLGVVYPAGSQAQAAG